ncbi:hypothetical protein [Paenibacillus agricola]|uniref:Uncharacterized protein n=1 Tax=Paenibacillus agricola TaxID=2716264 RepID=A0ABX0JF57_9BACL|nr:hypothetical protein [Paenibacillus agricola]NHN32501.1 hypothetical protein [Paenibacillus agricola]
MRWEEVREQFSDEWVVCEALASRSEENVDATKRSVWTFVHAKPQLN